MSVARQELQDLSDEAWQRMWARFEGLTDDEYFWEPAPGCWSLRERTDGTWRWETATPGPEPEPFTTIAWRMWHLIDMYGENRAPEWLGVPAQGDPIGLDDPDHGPPPTAAAALGLLERAHRRWDAHLALATDELLSLPIGEVGGPYAENSRAGYVLHMLDEFIHHSAEIALLRDLWRWQHPIDPDPLVERTARGDRGIVAVRGERGAELLEVAAAWGRWDVVEALVRDGVAPDVGPTTPLHRAAVAGELALVQLLVDRGADVTRRDPRFDATPQQWAAFADRSAVAEWLAARTPD
jgi:hypothetical protein